MSKVVLISSTLKNPYKLFCYVFAKTNRRKKSYLELLLLLLAFNNTHVYSFLQTNYINSVFAFILRSIDRFAYTIDIFLQKKRKM